MATYQHTLKQDLIFKGIGVHSGQYAEVTLKPAPVNTGIILRQAGNPDIATTIGTVVPLAAMHATVIMVGAWRVSTIEHLMAALGIMGVDNALIELQGDEVPILDGSAYPFVQEIERVGLQEQSEKRAFLTPTEELSFSDAEKRLIRIIPAKGLNDSQFDTSLHLSYTVDFEHPLIRSSEFKGQITTDFFANEVSPARTFGFIQQLPYLRSKGLALGSSLGNTVVIGEEEYLNVPRFDDEFIRHKVLDLLGDLTLLGKPLAGTVIGHKTGHSFNRLVIEHYLKHPEQWRIIG